MSGCVYLVYTLYQRKKGKGPEIIIINFIIFISMITTDTFAENVCRMRENKDENNSEYGHFLRSV